MEAGKGLAESRKSLDKAAGLKATAIGGVFAQRTLQEWDELASVGAMRQSPLAPPASQPASRATPATAPK